ncbi:MAG TPA: alpha/beta fold hydrolase [Propionibacteriaceae bacterium]
MVTLVRPATWWWPLGSPYGQRPVLFFPPSGAEPSAARGLLGHGAGLRFGVLQLPGRGERLDEPAPTDLRPLIVDVADAVAALDGPPALLVGHSFGGLLAYGVTAELEDRGTPVARLITVASVSPSSWTAELAADRAAHTGGLEDFVRRRSALILANGGVPAELLAHPEFSARAAELTRVDVGLSFGGFEPRVIQTPTTTVVARDDTVLAPGAGDGWGDIAAGDFRRFDVPGGHFFYRSAPGRLVAQIRMDLQSLDGGYELG